MEGTSNAGRSPRKGGYLCRGSKLRLKFASRSHSKHTKLQDLKPNPIVGPSYFKIILGFMEPCDHVCHRTALFSFTTCRNCLSPGHWSLPVIADGEAKKNKNRPLNVFT